MGARSLRVQYAVAAGWMQSLGRDTMILPFNAGSIGVAPSCGSSRTQRSLRPSWLPEQDRESVREDGGDGVLPPDFMFLLAAAGMESAE